MTTGSGTAESCDNNAGLRSSAGSNVRPSAGDSPSSLKNRASTPIDSRLRCFPAEERLGADLRRIRDQARRLQTLAKRVALGSQLWPIGQRRRRTGLPSEIHRDQFIRPFERQIAELETVEDGEQRGVHRNRH
jgi:hypothetical protein